MKRVTGETLLFSLLLFAAAAIILAAAATSGCSSTPPTKIERALFDVTTNQIAVPEFVPSTTGGPGLWRTNVEPAYTFTPGPGAQRVTEGATAAGNLAGGYGGLVGALIGGALAVWGHLRSRRATAALDVVVQGVETARQTLRAGPEGSAIDEKLVSYLTMAQETAGVRPEVRNAIRRARSTSTARAAASLIRTGVNVGA